MVAFQSENPITGVHIVVTHLNSLVPALRRFLIIGKQWNSFGTEKRALGSKFSFTKGWS